MSTSAFLNFSQTFYSFSIPYFTYPEVNFTLTFNRANCISLKRGEGKWGGDSTVQTVLLENWGGEGGGILKCMNLLPKGENSFPKEYPLMKREVHLDIQQKKYILSPLTKFPAVVINFLFP